MAFVFTIFAFESRQLTRSRLLLFLCAFIFFSGMYGLINGRALIGLQQAAIDSIQTVQRQHYTAMVERFHEDTTTRTGKQLRAQAGIPQVVEFRDPPYTTFPPAGLSLMAIGLRDLHPFYDIIGSKESKTGDQATEFSNAEKLAAGTFDVAFVYIYLFPLLIIFYNYNCLSGEREAQTIPLLILHTGGLQRLFFWRFVFRFTVVFLLGALLLAAGLIMTPAGGSFPFLNSVLWLLFLGGYFFYWFAVCWLVIRFERSSTWNITCLGFIWLFFVWILPATINSYTNLRAPVPLRSGLVAAQRRLKEATWELPVPVLLDSFYYYNPQYQHLRKITDTAAYGNPRFLAYNDLLGRRNERLERVFDMQLQKRSHLLHLSLYVNPVSYTQYYLHALAGTELSDFDDYHLQVQRFRKRWQSLMTSYLINQKMFSEEDLKHLPRFLYQPPPDRGYICNLFYLVIISGLIILIAQFTRQLQ
ncbi:DUF3526 domain-containing protein [Chitinophaga sp. LS1]|uniref:DUF3526 domain-containing protein n=1 Tax=Chitinophaga sp. LS1 TaxID=3051176 RepID=UPI002AABDDCD|nr:DUF3526 domain-containing protein [Chitinophaga sp. LS1]WPV66361.1 DUF3526 domain-containing protein [Chitinophaga sp. LS1]